ncbi:MAG: hypothetical protein JWP44_3778 [Mucilaginibacter sp.]|nr:hypothetical protein [Mucilaginibacter sp.]
MENTVSKSSNDHSNGLVEIFEDKKIIRVKRAMIDHSYFEDVSATNMKIIDANLSDLEIKGAQLGGAYIHSIGMPPKGHPAYNPNAKQRPLKFEDCELSDSTFINCNLSNVSISDCNLNGMKINGILVEDLLRSYKQ